MPDLDLSRWPALALWVQPKDGGIEAMLGYLAKYGTGSDALDPPVVCDRACAELASLVAELDRLRARCAELEARRPLCSRCHGSGRQPTIAPTNQALGITVPCTLCNGTGRRDG